MNMLNITHILTREWEHIWMHYWDNVSQSINIKIKNRFMKSKEEKHENHANSFQMKTNQLREIINQSLNPKM